MIQGIRKNSSFGVREAVRREAGDVVSSSSQDLQQENWLSDLGRLFDQITDRYSFARRQLEEALCRLRLDPHDDWCETSCCDGLNEQVAEAFVVVVDGFREF